MQSLLTRSYGSTPPRRPNALSRSAWRFPVSIFKSPVVGIFASVASIFTLIATTTPVALAGARATSPSTATQTIVPYQAIGYQYLQVASGQEPSGWQNPSFDSSSWPTGDAAFGSGGGCPLQPTVKTHWDPSTDILVRKQVVLPAGASGVTIGIAVDNDARVYWNGTLVGSPTHEFCPAYNDFVFPVSDFLLNEGTNVLAVEGIDRGAESFLDVTVAGNVAPATVTLGPLTEVIRPRGEADLTARVLTTSGAPAVGVHVAFNIVSGPDQVLSPSGTTDANGEAFGSFASLGDTGVDTVVATATSNSTTLNSNSVKVQVADSDPLQTIGLLTVRDPSNGAIHGCTASVIPSYNQSTILTAAHCAYGNGNYFTFAFAPSFSGDVNKCGSRPHACKEPFGVWTGERAYVDPRWISAGDHSFDFAFVILDTKAGEPIERAVGGGLTLDFNANPFQPWTAYGYPGSPTLRHCADDRASLLSVGDGPDNFVISCSMNGDVHNADVGVSGGPWLTLEHEIGAVNSTSKECSPFAPFCTKELRGAQFQDAAETLSFRANTDFGTFEPWRP